MKKIDLGQTIAILANLGVLIGILLLVFELYQNRQITAAQTRADLSQTASDGLYRVSATPEISELWDRGSDGDELSEDESRRYVRLVISRIRSHENIHYQYRVGLYDKIEFGAHREGWRSFYDSEGARGVYCRNHKYWSPEFATEVDAILAEPCR